MQVILLERVKNLGFMGDVVTVKPGFARNFLLPQKKALRANTLNLKEFETRKIHLEADNLKHKTEAEAVAEKIKGISLVMIRNAGESGQLYGSVSAKDIADAMTAEGTTVAHRQITLHTPIKVVGLHKVLVTLHPEVEIEVETNVAMSAEEAESQAKGIDVIAEKRAAQQLEDSQTTGQFGAASREDGDYDDEDEAPKKKSSKKDETPTEDADKAE